MISGGRQALVLVAIVWLAADAAAQQAVQRYAVPGQGSLALDVPAQWRVATRSLDDPPSVYLQIKPSSGDAFNLQITSLWLDAAKLAKATPQANRERVEATGRDLLGKSVEKQLSVLELRGRHTQGHYFSLADRDSQNTPDDFKYVTQGSVITGELLTIFTLLHRQPAPPEKQQALRMLADATYVAGAPAAARPHADALQIADTGQEYELAVSVSRLVMTIPKAGLQRSANALVDHPRYFYFSGGGLNVSGWFEPAQGFSGIEDFWKKELAAWNKSVPAPTNVSFSRLGQWDSVLYDIPLPSGSSPNIRAHWVQSGTWIDLHVSLTSATPAAAARTKLIAFLQTIQVKEKDK